MQIHGLDISCGLCNHEIMDGFTQEHKREIEWKLIDVIISSLKQGTITEEELPTVASYILDTIKTVKNHDQLLQFLRDLSARWSIFSPVLVVESGEVKEKMEDKVASDVLKLAKENKIEEALTLAKTVTSS